MTLDGSLIVANGRGMTLLNGLTNNGAITLDASTATSILTFSGGDQTLGGTGMLELSASLNNRISNPGFDLTHGPGHTIRGSGLFLLTVAA